MLDKKYSDLDEVEKSIAESYIKYYRDLYQNAQSESSKRAVNSLFLLNSGGIVTILSYMQDKVITKVGVSSFLLFIIGLGSAFALVSFDYLNTYNSINNFSTVVQNYSIGEVTLRNIRSKVEEHNCLSRKLLWFGIVSAFCVVIGIFLGMLFYFQTI